MAVIDNGKTIDGPEVMPRIDAFNDLLREKGYWIFAWGLESPAHSKLFDNRNGAGIVTNSALIPHVDGQEYISGLWIVDVPSAEVAAELAAAGSQACDRKVELRPFH